MENHRRTAGRRGSVGHRSNIRRHLHLDFSLEELGIETVYIMTVKNWLVEVSGKNITKHKMPAKQQNHKNHQQKKNG